MKFTVFTDMHYYPDAIPVAREEEGLTIIQKHAEETGCDFIMSCGDFTLGPTYEAVAPYLDQYNNFHIPSYHSFGNHDTDNIPLDEMIKLYKMPSNYYYFDCKGYRIIVCDPNYFYMNGEYHHYNLDNYHNHPVPGTLRGVMPPEQVEWLRQTIDSAEGHCILISHESFEREVEGIHNQDEIQAIIREANSKYPHRVLMCINGHYHVDNLRILDNVLYFDLNTATFHFLKNGYKDYPKEMYEKYRHMSMLAVFNDPLHAVITVEGTEITIEGMETSYYMGVSPESTGNSPCDPSTRRYTPKIQSAKVRLD